MPLSWALCWTAGVASALTPLGPALPGVPRAAGTAGRSLARRRATELLERLALGLAFVALLVASSAFGHERSWSPLARALGAYSPVVLARGELWRLVGSALLVPQPGIIGPTTLVAAVLFLPYALAAGAGRAVLGFFAGHLVATLAAAGILLGGWLAGSSTAEHLLNQRDVGPSAGFAAVAGALAVLVGRRLPAAGWALGAGIVVFFTASLATDGIARDALADIEHLVAVATGMVAEAIVPPVRSRAREAGSWVREP